MECRIRGYIFIDHNFVPGEVKYNDGIITEVNVLGAPSNSEPSNSEHLLSDDERDNYIIPGLVDIHLHGCMGVDLCDCAKEGLTDENKNEIIGKMVEYERSVGVTSICPTTMTLDEDSLSAIMRAVGEYEDNSGTLAGVHLEGPFISYDKRGAQNPKYIKLPDVALVKRLNELSRGMVRLVTVAPEAEGAFEFIRTLTGQAERANEQTQSHIRCSLAHTTADYDIAMEAIKAGADHVTHMYNAMPPFLNRAPGVVGAAFDAKSTYVELICDGIHVHPSVVRATFEMFGADRIVLISDSTEATGMPDGKYALGGQTVYKQGSLATLVDGTIAGSATNLFDCMKMAIKIGIPREDAITAATFNPAKSLGLEHRVGSIAVGKEAKLIVCDQNLNLKRVIS